MEFNLGIEVTHKIQKMFPNFADLLERKHAKLQGQINRVFLMLAVGILGMLFNVAVVIWAMFAGTVIAEGQISANSQNPEATGIPFEVHTKSLVRVALDINALDNGWAEVQLALVQDGTAFHVTDTELSFYSGYDDGAWTEGSRSGGVLIRGLPPGPYEIMLTTLVGMGEESTPRPAQHLAVDVRVIEGARSGTPAIVALLLCGLTVVFGFLRLKALQGQR
jgi:hypothetical protein